jgi:antitoxin HicB
MCRTEGVRGYNTKMAKAPTRSIDDYMVMHYPVTVTAAPEGGYVIEFPDLPGGLTQGETLVEAAHMAEDARRSWNRIALEDGMAVPLPNRSSPRPRRG